MSTSPSSQPNIILIMADDMGYSDIGCFGSEIDTPNLDALASGGVRMSQMYNCARCCPTRASLLTGLYPHQAGVGHMVGNYGTRAYQGYLRKDAVTMAEVLKGAGYNTLMSGKWHCGGGYNVADPDQWKRDAGNEEHPLPTQRGFDRFYGILNGAGSFFDPNSLMDQEEHITAEGDDYYFTDDINDKACEMIHESLDENQDRPFFLYLAHTAPHWPLHAKPEDIEKYRGKYDAGWDKLKESRYKHLIDEGLIDKCWENSPRDPQAKSWDEADHKEWESLRMAVYAAQVDSMDQGIGRVVETLKDRGVFEDTIIVFLSDNGGCAEFLREDGEAGSWPEFYGGTTRLGTQCHVGNNPNIDPGPAETFMSYDLPWANASNAPFRLFKHWTHEGGISTPFLVSWPKGLAEVDGDSIVHEPGHIIDLMSTFVSAAGATYPSSYDSHDIQPMEGRDLLPLWRGDGFERDVPIFWEHEKNLAVRDGKWKLVQDHREGKWELYDCEADRTELNDLSEQEPEIKARLEALYDEWAERCEVKLPEKV